LGSEIDIGVGGCYASPHRGFSGRIDNFKSGPSLGIDVLSIDKELPLDFG
jgi:hypothetical protein